MNIDTIEKFAQMGYDPMRIGGTVFAQRRPSAKPKPSVSVKSFGFSVPRKATTAITRNPQPVPVTDVQGFKQQYVDMVRRFNSHVMSNRGRYSDRAVKDIAGNLRNIYGGIGQNATPAQMQEALSKAGRMMSEFRSQRQIRPGDSITVKGHTAPNGMQTTGAMKGWHQYRPGVYWKPGTSGNRGGDWRMAMRSDPSGYARQMLRIADRAMLGI